MRWRIIKSRFKGRFSRGGGVRTRRGSRGQGIPGQWTTRSSMSRWLWLRRRHLAMSFFDGLLPPRGLIIIIIKVLEGVEKRNGSVVARVQWREAFRCVSRFNYIPQSQTRVTQFCVLQLLSTCCCCFYSHPFLGSCGHSKREWVREDT